VILLQEFKDATERWGERTGYPTHDQIADELGAKQVNYDIVDTTRWGQVVEYVYERDGEFVKVTYEEGSGDSDIDYSPEFTDVVPVTKTVVTYVPVEPKVSSGVGDAVANAMSF
jgi:hypothetical protein